MTLILVLVLFEPRFVFLDSKSNVISDQWIYVKTDASMPEGQMSKGLPASLFGIHLLL